PDDERHAGGRAHARRALGRRRSAARRHGPRALTRGCGSRDAPSSSAAESGNRAIMAAHRIVIVGGGAGGLPLACVLGRKLGRRGRAEVTLVDPHPTHVWKPLLHEVAAGRMDPDAHGVDYPALAYRHGFRFRQGAMEGLDREARTIRVAAVRDDESGEILPVRDLPWDTLVLAVGSESNDFGVPGVAEHAIPLDTLRQAERFHRRLLAASVRADARKAQGGAAGVDIVIIGAGA